MKFVHRSSRTELVSWFLVGSPFSSHFWFRNAPDTHRIHRQSFHFDTEDTGPAYTQVQIQHRDSQRAGLQ